MMRAFRAAPAAHFPPRMDRPNDRLPRSALTQGPVTRSLLAFAMPTIVANLLQTFNLTINAMWLGHLVGPEGLAAAANVNLILGLIHMVTLGFGMAVTILIARAMGAGDTAAMRRSFGAGIGLFSVAGVVLGIAGTCTAPWLLSHLGMPPEVYPLALEYAHISFASTPVALLFAFLDEQSNPLQILLDVSPDIVKITQGTIVLTVVIAYEVVRRYGVRLEQRQVAATLDDDRPTDPTTQEVQR